MSGDKPPVPETTKFPESITSRAKNAVEQIEKLGKNGQYDQVAGQVIYALLDILSLDDKTTIEFNSEFRTYTLEADRACGNPCASVTIGWDEIQDKKTFQIGFDSNGTYIQSESDGIERRQYSKGIDSLEKLYDYGIMQLRRLLRTLADDEN